MYILGSFKEKCTLLRCIKLYHTVREHGIKAVTATLRSSSEDTDFQNKINSVNTSQYHKMREKNVSSFTMNDILNLLEMNGFSWTENKDCNEITFRHLLIFFAAYMNLSKDLFCNLKQNKNLCRTVFLISRPNYTWDKKT